MHKRLTATIVALIAVAIAGGLRPAGARQAAPPRTTTVSGTVELENGGRATGIGVAVFGAGANPAELDATRMRAVAVSDGAFTITDLPPGSYRLALITASEVAAFPNREVLTRIERAGLPFNLRPGESTRFAIVARSTEPPAIVTAAREALETIPAGPGSSTPPGRLPPPAGVTPRPESPGSISGVITDSDGKGVANVPVIAGRRASGSFESAAILPYRANAVTDANGAYRITNVPAGPYLVIAMMYATPAIGSIGPMTLAIPAAADASGRAVTILTTFFPGTARSADARTVNVGVDERRDVNFTVRRGEVTAVRGVIRSASTRGGGFVTLMPESVPDQISGRNVQRARLESGGRFTLPDVPSGSHVITYNDDGGWMRETITVDAAATPAGVDLALDLSPNLTVSGRVELHATRAESAPDPQRPIIMILAPQTPTIGQLQRGVLISASGEFSTGVPPGDYVFRVLRPDFWLVVSGAIGDRDTIDGPVTIDRDRSDAVVILSDTPTGIRGTVTSATGGAIPSGRVVIFPDDPRLRAPGSSRVRVLPPNPGGTFSATGLPPGRYLVAVAPPGAVTNSVLSGLAAVATPVDVVAGETRVVSIVGR